MLICLAILKHGIDKFSLDILEYCSKDDVIDREQHYLDIHQPKYNMLKKAGSSAGYVHTEASLVKMKNRIVSEATLQKMRDRVQTEETISKIRNSIGISVVVTDVEEENATVFPSRKEAAKHLKVSDSTVGRYIRIGKLLFGKYKLT